MANKGEGAGIRWIRDNLDYCDDACLMWPLSINSRGYGHFGYNGQLRQAHRVMCELVHGKAPAGKPHAAHSCGVKTCVNPRHISWKTRSENEHDKKRHGLVKAGKGSRTKLTPKDVAFIRASKGYISADKLAERFKMSRTGVLYWWGTTHEPVPPGMHPFTIRQRAKKAAAAKAA